MIVERPALERRVLASLDAGRIPVVLGGCGSGLTSLLLRLERAIGETGSQYLDFGAAATTPERTLAAIVAASRIGPRHAAGATPGTPRDAFDALAAFFDQASVPGGAPATFLVDEVLDIRTFENFPGLRQVQRDFVARLARSPTRFAVASRFTARAHRLLRDAPPRFEVIHVPALTPAETQSLAAKFGHGRHDAPAAHGAAISALSAGRAGYAHLLIEAMASNGHADDPVAALAALFKPEGRLTARCRESYEFRLHRARGYGALKAILGILAETEPLNLTEISHQLHRTPGSTKDYLSWLEDVDLVTMTGKRYTFDDPLVRLFVRLHARPVPPTDADVVREARGYAQSRVAQSPAAAPPATVAAERTARRERTERPTDAGGPSGIIEID